jgi:hypothetical protein
MWAGVTARRGPTTDFWIRTGRHRVARADGAAASAARPLSATSAVSIRAPCRHRVFCRRLSAGGGRDSRCADGRSHVCCALSSLPGKGLGSRSFLTAVPSLSKRRSRRSGTRSESRVHAADLRSLTWVAKLPGEVAFCFPLIQQRRESSAQASDHLGRIPGNYAERFHLEIDH